MACLKKSKPQSLVIKISLNGFSYLINASLVIEGSIRELFEKNT
ncbi:hypothetical protein U062_00681 [Gammaproteobacteria bacterium MOLA455]|nr:hypothetical protein U062_00681 [Gammaproteobacteria bacterium MOLA455]